MVAKVHLKSELANKFCLILIRSTKLENWLKNSNAIPLSAGGADVLLRFYIDYCLLDLNNFKLVEIIVNFYFCVYLCLIKVCH